MCACESRLGPIYRTNQECWTLALSILRTSGPLPSHSTPHAALKVTTNHPTHTFTSTMDSNVTLYSIKAKFLLTYQSNMAVVFLSLALLDQSRTNMLYSKRNMVINSPADEWKLGVFVVLASPCSDSGASASCAMFLSINKKPVYL